MQASDVSINRATTLTTTSRTPPIQPRGRSAESRAREMTAGTASRLENQRARTTQAARRPTDLQVIPSRPFPEQERQATPPRIRLGERRASPVEFSDPSIHRSTALTTTSTISPTQPGERSAEPRTRIMTVGTASRLENQRARTNQAVRRATGLQFLSSRPSPEQEHPATPPRIRIGERSARPAEEFNYSPSSLSKGRPPQRPPRVPLQQRPLSPLPPSQERLRAGLEPTFASNEEATDEVDLALSLSLQTLLHRLMKWVQSPTDADLASQEAWMTDLRKIIQEHPCATLEPFQVRLLLLRQMVELAQKLPGCGKLVSLLQSHCLHTEQVIQGLSLSSTTPVQDSLWKLHKRILRLPSIEPDLFGAAVTLLNEKLPQAFEDDPLIKRLTKLIPWLLPPSHHLYFQERNSALRTLQKICGELRSLTSLFAKVPEGFLQAFCRPVETLANSYQIFLETFEKASEEERQRLCIPKAQLSGVGLGYFLIDQEIGRQLLCRDIQGKECRTIESGTHVVCHLEGVFYKPNPKKKYAPTKEIHYIAPEREFAIYALYQLLGFQGLAQTALLKVQHCLFEGQKELGGGVLQASCGVEGISLKDLLGMHQLTHLLDCSLKSQAVAFLSWLLAEDRVEAFARTHPHLSPSVLDALEPEDASQILLEAFEAPEKPRCLEFNGQFNREQIRRELCGKISRQGAKPFVAVLAMLAQWPPLAQKGSRQNSYDELTDLYLYALKAKRQFPFLLPSTLLATLRQLLERFDLQNFSAHFLVTLLTDPCDHKSDNFMVTMKGQARVLHLFGIDNDQIFSPSPVGIRTLLYLLPAMDQPIDLEVWQAFKKLTPERLLIDWLITLEKQNERYAQWRKQGTLTEKDLFEEGSACLEVPLKLESSLISTLYRKTQAITQLLRARPQATHRELFQYIYPQVAAAYERANRTTESLEEAYSEIKRLRDQNPLLPSLQVKQLPRELALTFLSSLPFDTFSLPTRVALTGKALEAFPSAMSKLPLPVEAARQAFFFEAVNQGLCALVARLLEEERIYRLGGEEEEEEHSPLLRARNSQEQTALLQACLNLDKEMMLLLVQYGAPLDVCDGAGCSPLACLLSSFSKAPERATAAIRWLAEQPGLTFNTTSDREERTALHQLVDAAQAATDEAESLLSYLISKGASPELKDDQGRTVLDLAIELQNERMVIQLIKLGAGRMLNVSKTQVFFRGTHRKELFSLLQAQSLHLRWHIALEALRCPATPSSFHLEGVELGSLKISAQLATELFDGQGNVRPQISYGRRNVAKLIVGGKYPLFFKQYPEMPGIEYAINQLFELLIGHGTSLTDLVRVTSPQGKSYPMLISQGIEGDNLHDVLSDATKSTRLQQLDRCAFWELFFSSLLVNFEDAKPDNFILEPLPNGHYRLVGIDNDHAFVPPLLKEGGRQVQVKCILYCLELMQEPIDAMARERFLAQNPEKLIPLWLGQLQEQNQRYVNLFPDKERKALVKGDENHTGVVIPIPFRAGAITHLYQQWKRLQTALKQSQAPTGFELLRQVIPELGTYYEEAFHTHTKPLERFFSLTKTQYSVAVAGRYQTLIQSRQLLQSMAIPEKSVWAASNQQGPVLALEEFGRLEQEIRCSREELKSIRDALQEGNVELFLALQLDLKKEEVVNGVPGTFEGIDFEAMRIRGQPGLKRQQTVLKALLTGHYRSLYLKGCAILDERLLKQLLTNSPQLHSLHLSHCAVDQKMLNLLAEARYLTRLRLSDVRCLKQMSIPHGYLHQFHLKDCHTVETLVVSSTLKSIKIEGCGNLTNIEAQKFEPTSKSLFMGKTLEDFSVDSLHLKACPKLQPWWGLFSGWLKESPKHDIHLRKVVLKPNKWEFDNLLQSISELPPAIMDNLRADIVLFYCSDQTCLDLADLGLMDDAFLALIAQKRPQLTQFNLEGCSITDKWLKSLVHYFPQLNKVNLRKCKQTTDEEIKALVQGCPQLTRVNLDGCDQITDEGIRALTQGCPQLTDVNLSGCKQITDEGIRALAQGCPQLTLVKLAYCNKITDSGIRALAHGCPQLTEVDLSDCWNTDEGIGALAQGCPQLIRLNLNECSKITDSVIKVLVQGCPQLTGLCLGDCIEITDEGIRVLTQGCPQLTQVELGRCMQITNERIRALAQDCPNLTQVNLFGLYNITDREIRALAQACPQLTEITLMGCFQTTDEGIRALARSCPQLTHLNLTRCEKITDSGIKALARGCTKLTNIYLTECSQITDKGVKVLAQSCPQLTHVNLERCWRITDLEIRALRRKYRGLRIDR